MTLRGWQDLKIQELTNLYWQNGTQLFQALETSTLMDTIILMHSQYFD